MAKVRNIEVRPVQGKDVSATFCEVGAASESYFLRRRGHEGLKADQARGLIQPTSSRGFGIALTASTLICPRAILLWSAKCGRNSARMTSKIRESGGNVDKNKFMARGSLHQASAHACDLKVRRFRVSAQCSYGYHQSDS